MGLFNFARTTVTNITRNAKNRLRTFGKVLKADKSAELPREQKIYQDWLKEQPTQFRQYNRKTKLYEPKIPRGSLRNSEMYEEFVEQLNEYLNTTQTYQDIKRMQDSFDFVTGHKITMDSAVDVLNIDESVAQASSKEIGTDRYSVRVKHAYNATLYEFDDREDQKIMFSIIEPYLKTMPVNEIYDYVRMNGKELVDNYKKNFNDRSGLFD